MSLKFNEALKILSEGLSKPSKPEHKLYTQDAIEISDKINQELINMNSIFKESVTNWENTCTYLLKDIYKIWIPYLYIKMPFKIEPQLVQCHHKRYKGLKLKTSTCHPAVENGYVNGLKLTKLFYWDIKRAIERLAKVNCKSGKTYNCLHTEFIELDEKLHLRIVVNEQEAQEAPSILYQFNIIFTFPQESPNYLFQFHFFHKVINQNAMAAEISEVVNKINMLLLKFHLDSSLTVEKMHNITTHTIIDLNTDKLEDILLETMKKFIPFLKNPGLLTCAYGKLWQFKQADSVKLSELKEVFFMQ